MRKFTTIIALLFATQSLGIMYRQTETYQGAQFLDGFVNEVIPDPTHGRVKYVDEATAKEYNLTFGAGDHFILRGDSTKKVTKEEPGRMSVRLRSKKLYGGHVSILDLLHMPEGCSIWPAYWYLGDGQWPDAGEIDVLEGINGQGVNLMTLHTKAGCTMSASATRSQTGNVSGNDCHTGCSVSDSQASSFGPAFNAAGGGWYAVERSSAAIKIWFWPRNAANVPNDIRTDGALRIDPDGWGTPSAYFPGDTCNINEYFAPQRIIINLTFCGDWAGTLYSGQGCPGDCNTYVDENPDKFVNANFDIRRLSIYTV